MEHLLDIQMEVDNSDIETWVSTADLVSINFKQPDPQKIGTNVYNHLLYKLDSEVYNRMTHFDSENKDIELEVYCLRNKYLYNFCDGTLSYLKALKSMDKLLEASDQEEINLVCEILNNVEGDGKKCYVSLGCGNGEKDSIILKKKTDFFDCYYPIDINSNLMKIAFYEVSKKVNNIDKGGYVGDFTQLRCELFSNLSYQQKIFLCLGHTIGNYQEKEILKSIYDAMGYCDYVIISFEKLVEEGQDGARRYKSSENTDFLLNPFKSMDVYSYVRHRYIKRSIVTGLSDISKETQSYLFSLGTPKGSSLSPLHIIWTNRYSRNQIESFFINHRWFECIKIEEGFSNIVVLLKKKEDITLKIQRATKILMTISKDQEGEKKAKELMTLLESRDERKLLPVVDNILKLEGMDQIEIISGINKIKNNKSKKRRK